MEENTKPRAGAILLSAQWFFNVGLQGDGSQKQSELTRLAEADVGRIRAALEPGFDLVYPGPISTLAQARAAVDLFRKERVTLIIIVHVLWSEDGPLVLLLRELPELPLLLWCYVPQGRLPARMSTQDLFRSSGPVGFLQGSAPLRRLGRDFSFVFGVPEDPAVRAELAAYSRVFSVAASLPLLRAGQVGPRCESMTGTFVDESRLLAILGVKLIPISYHRLAEEAAGVDKDRIEEHIRWVKGLCRDVAVSPRSLEVSSRASLALAGIVEKEDLGVVSIDDLNPELHALLETRPCLWVPDLGRRGTTVGMENDLISATGMWLARKLGGTSPLYTEIFTFDIEENCLLFGHAGMQDPAIAGKNPIDLVPDAEYEAADKVEGAWLHFAARPGRVTAVSLFADTGAYRIACLKGEALDVKDKLAGFTHALVRVKTPLRELFEKVGRLGMTQHFGITYDDVSGDLQKLCRVLHMEYVEL